LGLLPLFLSLFKVNDRYPEAMASAAPRCGIAGARSRMGPAEISTQHTLAVTVHAINDMTGQHRPAMAAAQPSAGANRGIDFDFLANRGRSPVPRDKYEGVA
jgi:hypothetical protein